MSTVPARVAHGLQNDYAHAIDTRDWELFRTLFVPDVRVDYPFVGRLRGMDAWLDFFVPFHEDCAWTLHVMTNHRVGERGGVRRASCYGDVRWTFARTPAVLHRSIGVYRDEIVPWEGSWRIGRRRLDLVLRETTPIGEACALPASVADVLHDGS